MLAARSDLCSSYVHVDEGAILKYSRAEVSEEVFAGFDYTKTTSRINYYILVRYGRDTYMAKLLHFIKVPHPSDPTIVPLRIAICTFFDTKIVGSDIMPLYLINKNAPRRGEEYYPVDTATIERKLVVALALVDDGETEPYDGVYGMTHDNQTTR